MAHRHVYHGGSNTSPYDTWAKAATTLAAAMAGASAGGDQVLVASDHSESLGSNHIYINGPTTGRPVPCYSVARAGTAWSTTDGFASPSAAQVKTNAANLDIYINGSIAIHHIWFETADNFYWQVDDNESGYSDGMRVDHSSHAGVFYIGHVGNGKHANLTLGFGGDTGTPYQAILYAGTYGFEINGLTIVNNTYRTELVQNLSATGKISNADLSNVDYLLRNLGIFGELHLYGCKLKAGVAAASTAGNTQGKVLIVQSDDDTSNDAARCEELQVDCEAAYETTTTRAGGAEQFDGNSFSWCLTTTPYQNEDMPMYTPWIEGVLEETGSKTFTIHFAHSRVSLLTDREAWIELDYFDDANTCQMSRASDRVADNLGIATPANQPSTSETWGGSPTYKQKASVTVTVARKGSFRARLAYGVYNDSSGIYVDPKVEVE